MLNEKQRNLLTDVAQRYSKSRNEATASYLQGRGISPSVRPLQVVRWYEAAARGLGLEPGDHLLRSSPCGSPLSQLLLLHDEEQPNQDQRRSLQALERGRQRGVHPGALRRSSEAYSSQAVGGEWRASVHPQQRLLRLYSSPV